MTVELGALLIGAVALVVSGLAWRAAVEANRTARFERRFEVYTDVDKFLRPWMRDAHPDLDELPLLIRAWDRSHFLFPQDVTDYLRRLWLDSIQAARCHRILSGEEDGDHKAAVAKKDELLRTCCDSERLRAIFAPHLRIYSNNWPSNAVRWFRKKLRPR